MIGTVPQMAGESKGLKKISSKMECYCDTIFLNVPMGVGLATKDGRILKSNDAMLRMMGYSRKEIEKVDLADTYQDPEERTRLLEQLQRDGRVQGFEARLKRKNGTPYHARLSITPIKLEGMDLLLTTAEDITELKKTQEFATLLSTAMKTSVDAVSVASPDDGRLIFCNESFLGWWKIETDYHDLHYTDCFDTDPDILEKAARATEKGGWRGELQAKAMDGRTFPVLVTSSPVTGRNGDVAGLLAIFKDVTEQKQLEEELRGSEKRYKQLWDNAPVAYHTLNTNGIITNTNRTEAEMLGYDVEEMIDRPIFEYILPEQQEEARKRFQLKIAGIAIPKANNRIYMAKDGSGVSVSIDDVLQRDDEGKIVGICTTMFDVTEHRKAEETIRNLAYYDAITKLPNRTFFGMRLATALTRTHKAKRGLVVMVLDIDHFKNVNDTLGHNVADGVLRIIGQRLLRVVRDGDTVARMGGDEFLVLLPETTGKEEASKTAQRILKSMRDPIIYAGHELHVSASIGVSFSPEDGEGNDELIKNADVAMYHVKQNGRNGFRFYTPDLKISHGSSKRSPRGLLKWITNYGNSRETPKKQLAESQETLEGIILSLAAIAEKLDPETARHQQRTAWLACAIASEMGLSANEAGGIRAAGTLHDIGKVFVPAKILNKSGPLTHNEMDLIKAHPQAGYEILKTIDFPWPIAQVTLQHQERMDGSGYPKGLSGEEIFQTARILCVADVVEAMSSDRPHRPALSMDMALEEISQKRGVLYDPDAVDACLALFTEKGLTFPAQEIVAPPTR